MLISSRNSPVMRLNTKGIKRKLLSAAIAGVALATFQALPASAATTSKSFSVTSYNNGVKITGTVVFNSTNGSARVTGTGYDNASDGRGPYLEVFMYQQGGNRDEYTSCVAGAGSSCALPAVQHGTSGAQVTRVSLRAYNGRDGNDVNNPGSISDFDNPYN